MRQRGYVDYEITGIIGRTRFKEALAECPEVQLMMDVASTVDELLEVASFRTERDEPAEKSQIR